jgi:tRNA threonylcarbamoyladenosine biosynthesis protein TsaB
MSLILNIDTTLEKAQVSLAEEGRVLTGLFNSTQKDHASFVQHAVEQLTREAGIELKNVDAIAVAAGPGSYTGLRVGMASAKGLCYALKKPLIALSTLEILTVAVTKGLDHPETNHLFCPMIDARRMEVFTAVYKKDLTEVLHATALILYENSFIKFLADHHVFFYGSGAAKWKNICTHPHAFFPALNSLDSAMALHAHNSFLNNRFADLAYAEPLYVKDFQAVIMK